jgi:biopolymer transport protein ExbB
VAVFAGTDGELAGIIDLQPNSKAPVVRELDAAFVPAIKTLTSTGTGVLPVDTTLGNAIKIAATEETWVEHILKGGPVMFPILALAVLASLIGIVKWVQLSGIPKARVDDLQSILQLLRQGDREGAMKRAQAVAHAGEDKALIEEVLYERMLTNKPKLERLMPFIALTAATAPLLGLLGTVTGMINTFKMITVFGTGDPKLLSAGISEALITTEYGLIVAIPALLLHALLARKAKGVLASMEQTAVGFINGLPEKA